MKEFIPEYFGSAGTEEEPTMKLQNLLYGLENGSFMDIKLGSDSLTVRGNADDEDQERIEKRI